MVYKCFKTCYKRGCQIVKLHFSLNGKWPNIDSWICNRRLKLKQVKHRLLTHTCNSPGRQQMGYHVSHLLSVTHALSPHCATLSYQIKNNDHFQPPYIPLALSIFTIYLLLFQQFTQLILSHYMFLLLRAEGALWRKGATAIVGKSKGIR